MGQHFLKDPNTARIVAAGVTGEDVVLEIGPGRGALTSVLSEKASLVHAVELDRDLLPALRESFRGSGNVRVHEGDALRFDYARLSPLPNKMVANLPYNVASPLVLRLLEGSPSLRVLRFMVQLEVARRMAARERTKDYGAYAVLVRLLADAEVAHKVSPNVFEPPPRVWSAVVEMRRKKQPKGYAQVKTLVLAAFKSRRKRLVNNLPEPVRRAAPGVLASLGHGPDARAEELSAEDFASLAGELSWGL